MDTQSRVRNYLVRYGFFVVGIFLMSLGGGPHRTRRDRHDPDLVVAGGVLDRVPAQPRHHDGDHQCPADHPADPAAAPGLSAVPAVAVAGGGVPVRRPVRPVDLADPGGSRCTRTGPNCWCRWPVRSSSRSGGSGCRSPPKVLNLPGEGAVIALCHVTGGAEFGKVKVIFDWTLVALAAISSLLLMGRLEGVREGTVISAFLVGDPGPVLLPALHVPGALDPADQTGRNPPLKLGAPAPMMAPPEGDRRLIGG